MQLKYGIISTASIVPRFIQAVRESGKGEIIAISSRKYEKAKIKADEYDIPKAYGDHIQLLEDDEVNVVYVATINSEHYRISKQALEHGKNVICEKPFTLKKKEAVELFALAKKKNLFIIEAQKSVFLPVMKRVKQIIENDEIGKVTLIDFTSSSDPAYNTWINSKAAGGGTLYGNASYFLELTNYFFDDNVTEVQGVSVIAPEGADSQCAINLKIGKDILVTSKISYDVLTVNKAMIYGKLGFIEIPNYWKARKATIHYHDGKTEILDFPCEHELVYEIQHIEECLENGLIESPVMSAEMTISTIGLMEKLQNKWYE